MNYDLGTFGYIPPYQEFNLAPGDTISITFDATNMKYPYGLSNLMAGIVGNIESDAMPDDVDNFANKGYTKNFKINGTITIEGSPTQPVTIIDNDKRFYWILWGKLCGAKAKFTFENVGNNSVFNALMFSGGMGNM